MPSGILEDLHSCRGGFRLEVALKIHRGRLSSRRRNGLKMPGAFCGFATEEGSLDVSDCASENFEGVIEDSAEVSFLVLLRLVNLNLHSFTV